MDPYSPDNLEQARRILSAAGRLAQGMTDDELIAAASEVMKERVPAPAVPAGRESVNARAWLADALTAGGFRAPEDRKQRADLGDGGPVVDLGVLGVLVMRHRSQGGGRPSDLDWDDAGLAARLHQPVEDFSRAQSLLDEVAADVGVQATPEPRWWEKV